MSMTKMVSFQINCDKKDCQVGVVEDVKTREDAAARMIGRGWAVILYPTDEKVLCPRCKEGPK